MVERWVSFSTPEQLGKAVSRIGAFKEALGGQLGCHPYNQDKPDQSVWWYFPPRLSNWPAYHLGKYFLDKPQWVDVPRLRVGLSIEKGLGDAYADVFKKPRFRFGPKWTWHRFVADLRTDRLAEAFQHVLEGFPGGLNIEVRSSATPPENTLSERPARVRLQWLPDETLAATVVSEGKGQLAHLGDVNDLNSLAVALKKTEEKPAHWVDVMVYSDFACGRDYASLSAYEFTKNEIWEILLAPLAPWVG